MSRREGWAAHRGTTVAPLLGVGRTVVMWVRNRKHSWTSFLFPTTERYSTPANPCGRERSVAASFAARTAARERVGGRVSKAPRGERQREGTLWWFNPSPRSPAVPSEALTALSAQLPPRERLRKWSPFSQARLSTSPPTLSRVAVRASTPSLTELSP